MAGRALQGAAAQAAAQKADVLARLAPQTELELYRGLRVPRLRFCNAVLMCRTNSPREVSFSEISVSVNLNYSLPSAGLLGTVFANPVFGNRFA